MGNDTRENDRAKGPGDVSPADYWDYVRPLLDAIDQGMDHWEDEGLDVTGETNLTAVQLAQVTHMSLADVETGLHLGEQSGYIDLDKQNGLKVIRRRGVSDHMADSLEQVHEVEDIWRKTMNIGAAQNFQDARKQQKQALTWWVLTHEVDPTSELAGQLRYLGYLPKRS